MSMVQVFLALIVCNYRKGGGILIDLALLVPGKSFKIIICI
jgi:hypothetical protein